ncbi:hypothetical protein SLE2022_223940 [Rubroshorea leprosula]
MDVLSLSTPVTPSFSSLKPSPWTPKASFLSFKPISSTLKTSLESHQSLSRYPRFAKILSHDVSSQIFASQMQEMAMRGAEADAMGLLLKDRFVFLGSDIDDFVADSIISQLMLLDAKDPKKDIRLFINSSGGSLSATLAIYDVVQLVRADVSTVALGIVASTASIILGGGTKGKRLAMPNARIMMHQPRGGAGGEAIDVEILARELQNNKKNVTRLISEFTGRPFEEVEKDIDRDRYMSPIEAVEYGIIDGVIDRDSIIPLAPLPEKVNSTLADQFRENPSKFMTPDIPDDEIY